MKKVLLVVLLFGGHSACQLVCMDSCCGSGGSRPGYYDIEGVSLTAVRSNGGSGEVLTAGTTVAYPLLTLRLAPQTRHYAATTPGGGLAWACSPLDPSFTERLDSVVVRSRYAYDAAHPAGTPLNDLLRVEDYGAEPLPAFLQRAAGQPTQLLTLRLAKAPSAAGPQQLAVAYYLSNGEVYRAETPEFQVQP